MNIYKLSAATKQKIIDFLLLIFEYNWDGTQTPLTIDKSTFVYIGQIVNTFDLDKNNKPINQTYLDGFHFDLLTDKELLFEEQLDENGEVLPTYFYPNITEHKPNNPKHTFA